MRRELKVGLFVLIGLISAGAIIFVIGDSRSVFASKETYNARFEDVQGLKPGSPVRMGGVDIGTVTEVQYSQDYSNERISVRLEIIEREAPRIRQDSTASVVGKGLLGDMMVNINPGSPKSERIQAGGEIPTKLDEGGFGGMMKKVGPIADSAKNVMDNLQKTTSTFAEDEFREDLRRTVEAIRKTLEGIEQREGYIGKLINDPEEAQRVSRLVENFSQTAVNLQGLTAELQKSVHQVNSGPGFAHDILYDRAGSDTVAQFGKAAEQLALSLEGVRKGDSVAHDLLYGSEGGAGDTKRITSNLAKMSDDLAHISADVRAGKGTIGALLVDPSIYEDLKMLLGNVQRNQVLRALVRYSVNRDEKIQEVQTPDQ